MNPVIMLTHNCLELTKRCVESVRNQDIPVWMMIVDNGSTDGTVEWLQDSHAEVDSTVAILGRNRGVSAGWNWAMESVFNVLCEDHALVIGNDTVLPPWAYRELLSYEVPFVTGVAVDDMDAIAEPPQRMPLTENPDFSCFLIRKAVWERLGRFDEGMVHYASDCDYHIRGHRLGMRFYKANLPYYHVSSSTMRMAPPAEREEIQRQADADRRVFMRKYGCLPGTSEYERLFK